jgi:hypothetical protein
MSPLPGNFQLSSGFICTLRSLLIPLTISTLNHYQTMSASKQRTLTMCKPNQRPALIRANSSSRVLVSAGDPSRGGSFVPRSSFESSQVDYMYNGTDTVPRESRRKLPRHSFRGPPTHSEKLLARVIRGRESSLHPASSKTCNKSLKELLGDAPLIDRKISRLNKHSMRATAA